VVFSFKNQNQEKPLCQRQGLCPLTLTQRKTSKTGTADIFRRFMVSLYVKGKENGHVLAYAHKILRQKASSQGIPRFWADARMR